MHIINTGYIFQDLVENFRRFDRDFLITVVQRAYESLLFSKKIYSIKFDGTNGDYLEHYANVRYPSALKWCEDVETFPFPDYFLRPEKESNHLAIIEFTEPIELKPNDYNYDLFFALKFSLTDIMKAEDFLQYHFESTFENDIADFKNFMETLCIKYKEFLEEKFKPLVQRFLVQKEVKIEPLKDGNKEFTTARQVLAIHYLMEQLGVYRNTDKTEIAKFIQFLNGKETGVSKINDTTIYKKLKSPLSKDNKATEADLEFIRPYFVKLGLFDIVEKINKEIGSKP